MLLFFIFIGYSLSQALLGNWIGLESVWDESRKIGGYSLSMYNLAYDPVPIVQSKDVIWPEYGETFFSQLPSALNKKKGFAFFALTTKNEDDWNFKNQKVIFYQYKEDGKYLESPKLNNICEFTNNENDQILEMHFSEKLKELIIIQSQKDHIVISTLDPLNCQPKKTLIEDESIDYDFMFHSGFNEEKQSIVFASETNNHTSIYIADLENMNITIKDLEGTEGKGYISHTTCLNDGSMRCIASFILSHGQYYPSETFYFEFTLYDHGTTRQIASGKSTDQFSSDFQLVKYQNQICVLEMNHKNRLSMKLYKYFIPEDRGLIMTHQMTTARYPSNEFQYDELIKMN